MKININTLDKFYKYAKFEWFEYAYKELFNKSFTYDLNSLDELDFIEVIIEIEKNFNVSIYDPVLDELSNTDFIELMQIIIQEKRERILNELINEEV